MTASTWTSVDHNGDKQLSTLARLSVVLAVWSAGWLLYRQSPDDQMPPPNIQSSTVVGYAIAALVIALFYVAGRVAARGRGRLVWNALTLALAAAWLLAALLTGYQRGWH